MKPQKGLKLKERFISIEKPEALNDITVIRFAGTLFGLWHIEGCFLLVDNIFLDTGNPNSDSDIFHKFLYSLDHSRSYTVLNTHMHEDHCGKNSLVQKELKADIYSPEKVENFKFVSPLMNLIWGRPEMFNYSLMDQAVYHTDKGRTIEVIKTPGHSPGHVSFKIMPDNIIYSGDAIPVPVRKRYVTTGECYPTELESLKKLLVYAREGTQFISAHHGIVDDSITLIEERIEGMSEVINSVTSHVESGITSEAEIGLKVFGKPDVMYSLLGKSLRCREDWTIRSILEDPA